MRVSFVRTAHLTFKMAINLIRPPYIVDAGPCPGVYFSEEAYKDHLKRQGIQHPLDVGVKLVSTETFEEEVAPIEAEICSEAYARQQFEEFFASCERGGGHNIRVELRKTIHGVRFVAIADWDDMS